MFHLIICVGLLPVLLELLEQDHRSVILATCEALVNMLYLGTPPPRFDFARFPLTRMYRTEPNQLLLLKCGGLDRLLSIYDSPNAEFELLSVVGSILVMLTAFDSAIRGTMLKADILSPLNAFLLPARPHELQKKALLLLYNLLLDDVNEQAVLDAGTVLPLAQLLGAPGTPRDVQKEVVAVLSPFSQNRTY